MRATCRREMISQDRVKVEFAERGRPEGGGFGKRHERGVGFGDRKIGAMGEGTTWA